MWYRRKIIAQEEYNFTPPIHAYRGESSGELRPFDRQETNENGFFFTPNKDIASGYAMGKEPNEFHLHGEKVLDLTNDTPEAIEFIRNWASNWDDEYDWVDRKTGEQRDPVEVVQSGELFDWEGDWSEQKWRDLQASAENAGYDIVVLPDWDNQIGMFPSVVVFDPEHIKHVV
jgi:hypothetical protein